MGNFRRNVFIVLAGSSLTNFFNLICQLLFAHRLIPSDFAVLNALLSISTVIFAPLGTLQTAVVKYTADFNSRKESDRISALLSGTLKAVFFAIAGILIVFWLGSGYIASELKIPSISSCYILALVMVVSLLSPVFLGAAQGLEFFGWFTSASVLSSVFKLLLVLLSVFLGWGINGALGSYALAALVTVLISYYPVRNYIRLRKNTARVNYRDFLVYFVPVAISMFCFTGLVSFDMILVKKYFSPEQSGIYSLAQMVGKIFLFLPSAISIVLFPRTAGLNARNQDTRGTLGKSLLLACGLCFTGCVFYNLFPAFVLTVLVGKALPGTVMLGRLFSISMTFFALVYIFISYFLSLRDSRFIKFMVASAVAEYLLIVFFHGSLAAVQVILCVNAAVLVSILGVVAFTKSKVTVTKAG